MDDDAAAAAEAALAAKKHLKELRRKKKEDSDDDLDKDDAEWQPSSDASDAFSRCQPSVAARPVSLM